ncbi:MAG: hypothetical protein HUK22_07575, partial [Thermoguttaceae bacterium]|nr:hypothetical protein [Thermoguttaceae bacterium]
MKPTKKIQIGLLAIALGFGSTAFSPSGTAFVGANVWAQDAAASVDYAALVKSQEALLKARRSLMNRDVASAERFANEAKATNAAYTSASDKPEYVFPLIAQYKQIESVAKTEGMSQRVKLALAKNYLEQAEGLRRCQDLEGASRLVSEARSLDVTFDVETINRKMDLASVAQRVSDDRLAAQAAAPAAAPLTGMSEATKRQVAAIQTKLQAARAMAAAGQTEQAEAAVRELQALGVPENAFAGGDSPAKFLRDVATQRSQAIRQVQVTLPGLSEGESAGYLYMQEADAALATGDSETALRNYRDALRYAAELDQQSVRYINDSIAKLTAAPAEAVVGASGIDFTQTPEAIQSEIAAFIAKQNQVRETEPREALEDLKQLRAEVEASALDASLKAFFVQNLDVAIVDTDNFLAVNGSRLAVESQNKGVDEYIREKRLREL